MVRGTLSTDLPVRGVTTNSKRERARDADKESRSPEATERRLAALAKGWAALAAKRAAAKSNPESRRPACLYNLGNLWRRLVLPKRIDNWSLTSLEQLLVKTRGRLVKHARYYWLLRAEGHLTRPAVWGYGTAGR